MNTHQDPNINLPLRGNIKLIYIFSFLIAILMTVTSIVGLLYRAEVYLTEELIETFVPNDVVSLVIGLPILLGSMWLTWRGDWIGLLCWPGVLFFISYNYIAYIFAMPLNWAFLIHLALVVLSVYALIGLVANIDGKSVHQRLSGAVPEKLSGAVLTGLGSLFFLRVIVVLVNAFANGTPPAKPELAVNIADFVTTPAWIIVGILLWRRKEFGYIAGLGLLFQGSMLFIALIAFFLLQPLLTTASFALADVIVIFAMGSVCFIPFALFIHGVDARTRTSPIQH